MMGKALGVGFYHHIQPWGENRIRKAKTKKEEHRRAPFYPPQGYGSKPIPRPKCDLRFVHLYGKRRAHLFHAPGECFIKRPCGGLGSKKAPLFLGDSPRYLLPFLLEHGKASFWIAATVYSPRTAEMAARGLLLPFDTSGHYRYHAFILPYHPPVIKAQNSQNRPPDNDRRPVFIRATYFIRRGEHPVPYRSGDR